MLVPAVGAFILVTVNASGSVAMQEFDDYKACKSASSLVGFDDVARKFRPVDMYCVPKKSSDTPPTTPPAASAPQ